MSSRRNRLTCTKNTFDEISHALMGSITIRLGAMAHLQQIEAAVSAPHLSFWRKLRGGVFVSLPVVVLAALLLGMLVPPVIYLIRASLYTTTFVGAFDKFTLQHYIDLFTNPLFFRSLRNTTIYAVGAAAVAITLGATQAWIAERTNTPLRKYVFLISIISLGIPSVLYTISFLLILGKV